MRIYDINPADGTAIDPAGRDAPIDPMRGDPLVPAGATTIEPPEVSDQQAARWDGATWKVVSDWRGHVYWTDDGQRHEIRELGIEPPEDALTEAPPAPIDKIAASAINRINADYQAEMSEILRAYPEAETLTWDKQEEEARKWSADNTAATPLLDAIAQGRSMDKAELVSRVLAKADAWIAASGLATGKRQALEDEISASLAAEDREAIETIKW